MAYPIFVFDLHGVLFRPDYKRIAQILYQVPKKYNLFLGILNPKFLPTFLSLVKKGAVPEEFIIKLGTKIDRLRPYIKTGIEIANSQKPQVETISIVTELKKNKFPQYIFSNIGEKTFLDLYQKYPEIISLFDGVSYTSQIDDYLKKPHSQAFEKYIQMFDQKFNDLIFIDNKKKNIYAAQKLGIESILFKNSYQLYDELKKKKFIL